MRVSYRKEAVGGQYTEHRLTAEIEGITYSVEHRVPDNAYSAIATKDAQTIIESHMWRQLMHTIEHNLRKAANATAQNPNSGH